MPNYRCKAVIEYKFVIVSPSEEAAEILAREALADDVTNGIISKIFEPQIGPIQPNPRLERVEIERF